MKTVVAMAFFAVFAASTSPAFAQTTAPKNYHTNVHTQYMKDDPLVCKESLKVPGADGSTAMAELPETVLLYNYRHVTGPNPVLERARALGAIRCYSELDNSGYMIGLRGAFEAMGGTVTVSRDGKTISVAKPGVSLKLVVGRPSIVLNGEERGLDVPRHHLRTDPRDLREPRRLRRLGRRRSFGRHPLSAAADFNSAARADSDAGTLAERDPDDGADPRCVRDADAGAEEDFHGRAFPGRRLSLRTENV
jgi:hypothetical protein